MQYEFKSSKVPAFLDFSLDSILAEIKLDKGDKKKNSPQKQKDTAASLFDDNIFSWDMDFKSKPLFDTKPEEEEKKKPADTKKTIEDEFQEVSIICIMFRLKKS